MALDPTARLSNAIDSIKKYFVDNVERASGIPITFDITLSSPKVQGVEVDKWVVLQIGPADPGSLYALDLRIYCCSVRDAEGFKRAQVRDTVMGYLIDTDQTDGLARIPLYRSYPSPTPWELIGGMVVTNIFEGGDSVAENETKYRMITCRLKWGAKA